MEHKRGEQKYKQRLISIPLSARPWPPPESDLYFIVHRCSAVFCFGSVFYCSSLHYSSVFCFGSVFYCPSLHYSSVFWLLICSLLFIDALLCCILLWICFLLFIVTLLFCILASVLYFIVHRYSAVFYHLACRFY